MKIVIDGTWAHGRYRVECECAMHWSGECMPDAVTSFSPALPLAETVVHMALAHPDQLLELRFSERFSRWLSHYWEIASLRELTEVGVPAQTRDTG